MAKKRKARTRGTRQQAQQSQQNRQNRQNRQSPQARQTRQTQRRRRQQLLVGGLVLLLVIGIGAFIRYRQQRALPPRLQGAVENHYTRGVAGAPVVLKEFSDFG